MSRKFKIHYKIEARSLLNEEGFLIKEQYSTGQEENYYVYTDYQGILQTITNETGIVSERFSFDPWGRRRNPVDWSFNNVPDEFLFDRGYTGHEHLDEFNLINMNGRVYDPIVARFLSPDPFVQSPDYTQSYNRYSYGLNNPLKYTDPSGYNYHPDGWTGGGGLLSFTPYFGPGYQGGIIFGDGNNTYMGGNSNGNDGFISNLHSGNGTYYDWDTGLYYNNDGMIISGHVAAGDYSSSATSYYWNDLGGDEVYRESSTIDGVKYLNIYYEGSWIESNNGNYSTNNVAAGQGDNFSLASLYTHFQVGGGDAMTFNMSSVNFGGATQRDLGLTGMEVGEIRPVNLFKAGTLNQAALAFGNVNMRYHGNNQFSIVGDKNSRFDFWPLVGGSSLARDAGNLLGAAINYNLIISPAAILIPTIFGGPFDVNFIGTTTIPK